MKVESRSKSYDYKLDVFLKNQNQILSEGNYKVLIDFNEDLIVSSIAQSTRFRHLNYFAKLSSFLDGNWHDVNEKKLRTLVTKLMVTHGDNGKETQYTRVMKIVLKQVVRFVILGVRNKPDTGELPMILFIKPRTVKDKLTREDLPTDDEIKQLLAVCSDSSRDKAMFAVHAEAGTRIGELLNLKIKDFRLDNNGGIIKVDGKTGVRPIRIVKSVPYLTRWLNDHPYKDNHDEYIWINVRNSDSFGTPMTYYNFNRILKKRMRQAGITRKLHSHLFRHKEITDLASKITESESRMRHGWTRASLMPSKYTHLNQDDLDEKMLRVMGVKKEEKLEEPIKECSFCHIKYPVEIRFCDSCSRPLDVSDAIVMEKENESKQKALVQELMRQERAKESRSKHTIRKNKTIQDQQKQIDELKSIVEKLTTH